MNCPAWCPKDVWGAAIKCAETVLRNLDQDDVKMEVGFIARAILAERERAAKVCRDEAASAKAEGLLLHTQAALWCAKSIEKGAP